MAKITFTALVKTVSSKALVSGDKEFRVLLVGEDKRIFEAGAFPSDAHVKVTIELADNRPNGSSDLGE